MAGLLLALIALALIVFLLSAWYLPYALRPMLRLKGRADGPTGMLANIIGLLLALMVAIVSFKAREKFGHLDSALNVVVDGVVAFLIAALTGAGVLLAIGKGRAPGGGSGNPT